MPVLHGGRKPIRVKTIKKTNREPLGGQFEGQIFEVEVTIKKGKKTKKIKLAEKRFYPGKVPLAPQFLNPKNQFKIMQELSELNRRKKLGLRINPTIRLREKNSKKPSLVLSKLNEAKNLTKKQKDKFVKDTEKQIRTCFENGFTITENAFLPVLDKKTGKVIAVISDFGIVEKRENY